MVICSEDSLQAGEPLIGSAPRHAGWLCLEQAGPWGRKAMTQSHLDATLGGEIETRANAVGVRPTLIRRPGRSDPDESRHPWLFLAHTSPDDPWLLSRRLDDPAEVLDLDLGALARGDRHAFAGFTEVAREMLFVCTNGKRDTCCARLGRPVAESASRAHPDRVWEITHTSGHRFAPTVVLLPSGHLHGRVLDAAGILEAADRDVVSPDTWRGRTTWNADGQAAEAVVRRDHGLWDSNEVNVVAEGDHWVVGDRSGRSWRVDVDHIASGVRAESCGKDATPIVHGVTRYLD